MTRRDLHPYVIAAARIVEQHNPGDPEADWARNRRISMPIIDLLGTTSAAIDVRTGEALESTRYYPNGATETYRAGADADRLAASDPRAFTGKEADGEVGVSYFGERYLVARIGRWATPDPLHVHAAGGGEEANAFHYVRGALLSLRDPVGLAEVALAFGQSLAPRARDRGVYRDNATWAAQFGRSDDRTSTPDRRQAVVSDARAGVPGAISTAQAWERAATQAATPGTGERRIVAATGHGGPSAIDLGPDLRVTRTLIETMRPSRGGRTLAIDHAGRRAKAALNKPGAA